MQDNQDYETNRAWVCEAMNKIAADYNRSSDTHLLKIDLPVSGGGFRDVFRRLRIGSKISWFSSLRNRIPLDVSS